MKKLITVILTLALLASLFMMPASALTETEIGAFKFTLIAQTMSGLSFTGDDALDFGQFCMRGMAVSKDGKYLLGGYLNPGGTSALEVHLAATGEYVSGLQFPQDNGGVSYPKGLATDDRGYIYAALAYNPNFGIADLAVVELAGTELKQISRTNIVTTSEPVQGAVKTGVNGITVENINGSYYAFVVVNYDVDYLAKIDVTDPKNPALVTSFGNGGLIDLQDAKYAVKDANYLDVDTDGTIYLAANTSSGYKVFVLSADGATIKNTIETGSEKSYGVALWKEYLLVTQQDSGKVTFFNKSTLAPVGVAEITLDNIVLPSANEESVYKFPPNSLCNVTVVNDIMFLGDQAADSTGCDQIFAVGLTEAAAATVASYAKAIQDRLDGDAPADTPAPDTTAGAPVDTPASDTTAGAPVDTPASPEATTPAPDTTKAPEEKGCGGMVAGGTIVLALMATAFVFKKRH